MLSCIILTFALADNAIHILCTSNYPLFILSEHLPGFMFHDHVSHFIYKQMEASKQSEHTGGHVIFGTLACC